MEDAQQAGPLPAVPHEPPAPADTLLPRWIAACQAFLVFGPPTQILIFAVLTLVLGMPAIDAAGRVPLGFVTAVALLDTVLIGALVMLFLHQSGEDPRRVIFGLAPAWPEIRKGLALVPVTFLGIAAVVLALRALVPSLHTVETNPLQAYLATPVQAALFFVVAVVAGGVREEVQRAFVLHRFEQRLGGIRLGLVLFTVAFGLMHFEQGADASIAIGLVGFWWGTIYIRRRSAFLPMANHAGFNALQVVQAVAAKAMGV